MHCYEVNNRPLTAEEQRIGIWISVIAVLAYSLLTFVGWYMAT